ncbi:Flagellar hook protein FlgE [Rubrivivax sp. A210]|uniref:flagellar hook protein FlgE n=1 Tax=Rubrivivax sp. A210 TaxID=2772301 RepID=UPI001917C468|nr:flagellar hook protein FlgE [Rubrivivax sp. A210]CAD5374746.1 Flagellar hook protein FlgE [Rubrivivax sp. A210]
MSFQQAVSGLNATSRNLDVIGNNIANASTIGAKSSRVEFADMYATAMAGSKQPGVGVTVAAVAQSFSQGSISSTSNPLDLAISGEGFFQVKTSDAVHYTRNGQFKLDAKGYIVNNQNHKLMGYPPNVTGDSVLTGNAQELQLSSSAIPPEQTQNVTVNANLDSRNPTISATFDPLKSETYSSATSVNAYDINGKRIQLTLYFQKAPTPASTNAGDTDWWNVYAKANDTVITDGSGAPLSLMTMTFDAKGLAPTGPVMATVGGVANSANRVATMDLDIPPSTGADGGTQAVQGVVLDLASFSQFASTFGVTKLDADGYAAGALTNVVVESTGTIKANFTNGKQRTIGQIELATFQNRNGLQALGGNEWQSSTEAGSAVTGVPGSGNLGALQTSSLEESNVDLTSELVSMMIAQRTYQANAQTIKTQDQVLQTLVNMR